MRFKQGTGDPSSFKHFLRHENITPGTGIRYVGNPFNVLFYLAGKRGYCIIYKLCVTAKTVSSLA